MIVGAVLSRTTIVALQVAALPQSSVAVHVLVTLYVPAQVPSVVASDMVIVTVASHASVAVGAVNTGTDGQLIGLDCIAHVIVGAVMSRTTMVPEHVAVLPQSSVAVQVRVAVYVPAHEPAVFAVVKVTNTVPSHASVAVASTHTDVAGQLTGDT